MVRQEPKVCTVASERCSLSNRRVKVIEALTVTGQKAVSPKDDTAAEPGFWTASEERTMGSIGEFDRAEFARIAGVVAARSAALLRTRVVVSDERRVVIASSDPRVIGHVVDDVFPNDDRMCLRVPLRLDNQAGEVLIEPSESEAVSPRLTEALVDLMIGQVAVVDRLPVQPELKNRFVANLLAGAAGDEDAVLRQAKALGLDLGPPRAVILIDAANYVLGSEAGDREEASLLEEDVRRRTQFVIASVVGFFKLPTDTIVAAIGEGELAVLKASNTRNLATWAKEEDQTTPASPSWANLSALQRASGALLARLRADTGATISIGVGRYHPGIKGLASSYQDARAALSIGRRMRGENRVHGLDGLGIGAFVGVTDERTKADLATHLLSPLDHEPGLLSTLDAFFAADCSPSVTACGLGIHRNTLAHRLDKVASMTGLDPRRFDDAVQIRLALVVRSLEPGHAAAGTQSPREEPRVH